MALTFKVCCQNLVRSVPHSKEVTRKKSGDFQCSAEIIGWIRNILWVN